MKPHVIDEADERALLDALRSGEWSSAEATAQFERAFAEFCGAKHCLLVTSGTTALELALAAIGIGAGDEVIVPGMTWPSVPIAILRCGAEPVAVDIDLATFGMNADSVAAAVTPRTKAIIPTHLFSSQTDLPPILEIAATHHLTVIEDCAHSPGARRFGQVLGTFGDAAFFSFNQKKLLSCGEGGCLITNDSRIYDRALALREVIPERAVLSGTHLTSTFQAALLTSQLATLSARLQLMQDRAELLRDLLSHSDHVQPLARLPGTDLQTYYNFCFRVLGVRDIAAFRTSLAAKLDLPMSGGYLPLSDTPAVGGRRLRNCQIAHYEQAVRFRHPALRAEESEIHRIAEAILATLCVFR